MAIQAHEPYILNLELDAFQGPLDVLLHLIREQDIDIFDIPIFQIAYEFQQYVEMFQKLDLERAGDYLAMSAELAQIKSKMLLPRDENEEEDPRKELVDKLIEHEQIQQAALFFKGRDQLERDVFRRVVDPCVGLPRAPLKKSPVPSDDLMFVFQDMLQRRLQRLGRYHQVKREHVSVRQRILWLCELLRESAEESIKFSELLDAMSDRVTIIATFLALLELGRLRRIRLVQLDLTDICIEATGDLDDLPMQDVASFTPNANSTELDIQLEESPDPSD